MMSEVTRGGKPINHCEIRADRLVPPPTPLRGSDEGVVHIQPREDVIPAPRPEPINVIEEGAPDYRCMDCGTDTGAIGEFYMVQHELWAQVVPEIDGMLCVGCLEERVGGLLRPSDFIDAPINNEPYPFYSSQIERSDRLKERLGIKGKQFCYYHMKWEAEQEDADLVCFECKHQFPSGEAMLSAVKTMLRQLGWPEDEVEKQTLSDVFACPYCAHDL